MRVRAIASILVAGAALAACGAVDSGVTAKESRDNGVAPAPTTVDTEPTTDSTPDTKPTDTTDTTDTSPDGTTLDTIPTDKSIPVPDNQNIIDFGDAKTPQSYDGFLIVAFKDIESFWNDQFPKVYGSKFQPLQGGIFAAYAARTTPIPGCQSPETRYRDVEGNAFYCSDGDFIVYDDDELLPALVKELGETSVGVVLAHEFGHAIQSRINELNEPTILKEQQADCFAGAWAAHIARGEDDQLTFDDNELKQGLVAMIQVRDPIDGDVNDPNAHGTGFDRVGAFQDGFIGGAERCKPFFTEDREKNLIDIPFDGTDGNLPFDTNGRESDIVTAMPEDLNRFWVQKLTGLSGVNFTAPTLELFPSAGPLPECDGVDKDDFKQQRIFYCKSSNKILVDEDFAAKLDADPVLGDMSVGYLLGEAYSEAVQTALNSTLKDKKRVLLNDCFTGAWVSDDVPNTTDGKARGGGELTLSAGDLDEAIVTAIVHGDSTSDTNINGTAFEKVDAFRSGVLGGMPSCQGRIPS